MGSTSDRAIDLWGIVDTGATECVLPYDVIRIIGAAQKDAERGDLADASGTERTLEYGTVDFEIDTEKGPLRWSAKVAFDEKRQGEALWGHACFLQYFNANFNGPRRRFSLTLKGPTPPEGFMPGDQTK